MPLKSGHCICECASSRHKEVEVEETTTVIAAGLSSIIGFEREAKNKPANVRMHILVGSGSATFIGVALLNTHNWQLGDVNRVAAGVASGVGFLGAGTSSRYFMMELCTFCS